ncbi:hypothetical protein Cst_c11470 [Thermoclostridium stercorarium subsp. stercorarium DSM 8532]|jgi:hypothetical protein|uniref:YlzJ-like protein n=3 Tax=Thermoclostridium stercorarium TaxID=1510 RepID=L7VRH1_THES1|nr:YlzJ-like family protein [Thermoclostridium stercorarium]AGC68143.1 hypothetical protein Cst_c11470 [Thermoclostridium stercorarium subsp. stercorarium DSM 8532]AGI39169.1 hypothetical protein Clst_1099 [Thermoclostridium stercorarium subsp. stercorarium DSM 8532]ANW98518.1 hypothetical protein CSTERTH_05435 [Thermoclostridium stercorarium subsp. thermolacticum DSM 2910]ANX01053.1 hypothetical protein CSTERLE_05390 [Thermoclostridium stercorarium subsp. leptospartum DSM 9219]
MIYSIVPFEQLYYSENKQERMEVVINGEKVILLRNDNNTYTVERLISTNPKVYLNPEFTPGNRIIAITSEKEGPEVKWEIITDGLRLT